MARIPIQSLSNGTALTTTTEPRAVAPLLSPLVGVTFGVVQHGNSTPLAVYAAETGPTHLSSFESDSHGVFPGWLDTGDVTTFGADLVVTTTGGSETFVLAPPNTVLAPLASPALTGSPTAPTQTALDSSTKVATTAYADSATAVEKTRALAAEAALLPLSQKGAASGVAVLGSDSTVGGPGGSALVRGVEISVLQEALYPTEFHTAVTGSDADPGTHALPVRTFAQAVTLGEATNGFYTLTLGGGTSGHSVAPVMRQVTGIQGAGRDITVIQPTNCEGFYHDPAFTTVKATFRDFTVNGSNGAPSCIRLGNGSGDQFSSVRCTAASGSPGHGLYADDTGLVQSAKLIDVQADLNVGDGIHWVAQVHSQERSSLYECNASGNGGAGLYAEGNNWHIFGGTYQSNGMIGIQLTNGAWAMLWDPVIRTNWLGQPTLNVWAATTSYSKGNRVKPTNIVTSGNIVFRCETAGTSGSSEPTWASVATGGTVSDGTVTWRNMGPQVSCGGAGIYDAGASFIWYQRAADNATRQPILGLGGCFQQSLTTFPSGGSPMILLEIGNGTGLVTAMKWSRSTYTNPQAATTHTMVSGTPFQPNANVNSMVAQSVVLNPTASQNATVLVRVGPAGDNTDPQYPAPSEPAGGTAGREAPIPLPEIPAGHYVTITLTNATFARDAVVRNA